MADPICGEKSADRLVRRNGRYGRDGHPLNDGPLRNNDPLGVHLVGEALEQSRAIGERHSHAAASRGSWKPIGGLSGVARSQTALGGPDRPFRLLAFGAARNLRLNLRSRVRRAAG